MSDHLSLMSSHLDTLFLQNIDMVGQCLMHLSLLLHPLHNHRVAMAVLCLPVTTHLAHTGSSVPLIMTSPHTTPMIITQRLQWQIYKFYNSNSFMHDLLPIAA